MKLSQLLRELSFGELSNLAMSSSGSGTIVAARIPQVVTYANEALLRLYSRFVLRENSLILEMVDHLTDYELAYRYARSNTASNAPHKYIMDYETPFQDDVIRVTSVYDGLGRRFLLNDEHACNSLFTPRPDVLQVPSPIGGEPLSVTYQARHVLLNETDLNQEVYIPNVLRGALKAYIASLVHSHMNTQEMTSKGQEHLAMAEVICGDVEEKDSLGVTLSFSDDRFCRNGWR